MSQEIYEHKDDHNWFIGKWDSFNYLTSFGDDQVYNQASKLFFGLLSALELEGLQLHLVRYQSDFRLLSFMVDITNQETGRQLTLAQHQGAILVTEQDQLLHVQLPESGLPLTDFFGQAQSGFGDTVLIATRNEGKAKEFGKIFGQLGIKVQTLNDYPDLPEVAETGLTFEENARLKAETISQLTGQMVLADDSGLKVDILGGLPGVWSARFSGPDATDDKNNAKLLHELAMVFDQDKRSAQFHTCLVVAAPGRESLVVEADWPGYIATAPQGDQGFGYDPLFLVGETGKTAAQLLPQEKNAISHRGQAVKKLVEVFPAWQRQA